MTKISIRKVKRLNLTAAAAYPCWECCFCTVNPPWCWEIA